MPTAKHIKHDKPRLTVVGSVAEQPLSILLVDSDETSFPKARQVLHGLPIASLKTATAAETASALIAAEHFDLVIVDPASLPSGFDLLKEIKDNYRWIATLVASHDHSPQFMRQVVKCRIDGILFRPMTAEEFVEQVLLLAKAVRLSRQRQQKRVLPISPAECLRICRDKQLLLDAVQGKVPVPGNEPLTQEAADRVDSFPRFVKPRLGAGSRGIAKIERREDFDTQPKDGSVMLQEYLPGEEFSVDVYVRRDGVVIGAVPRERMKVDSGIAIASRTVNVPEVIQAAIRTAEIIGIRGVANVQFKRAADAVFKLLEVNPRFPGTLPLTAAAGVDIPKLMVDEAMGRPMPDKLLPFKELMVVRYWTERYFDAREWEALCRRQ